MTQQYFRIFYILALLIFVHPANIYSQDVNIIPYLKQIESGKADEVKNDLTDLKERYPESPSVMFLNGVLTENGQKALVIYENIVDRFPDSKYADAALYRIYSYYYALGLYELANKKLSILINNYPASPYINIAKQNQVLFNPEIEKEDITDHQDEEQQASNEFYSDYYKYTIQAGAFSNGENAQSLKENFEQSGIFSEIEEKQVAGTTFHVVYVGRFVTDNEAESFLKTINTQFNLKGRVVNIYQ